MSDPAPGDVSRQPPVDVTTDQACLGLERPGSPDTLDGGYTDLEDTTVSEGRWAISNINTLEWALKRAANLKAEKEAIMAAAAEAQRRIAERRDKLIADIERGSRFFQAHIEKYAASNRETLLGGGRRKSRTFLYGTVGWRKRGGRLVVVDPQALEKWLLAQDDSSLYRVKVEPAMKELQANFAQNGVIPPGTEYIAETEAFYIDALDPMDPKLGDGHG